MFSKDSYQSKRVSASVNMIFFFFFCNEMHKEENVAAWEKNSNDSFSRGSERQEECDQGWGISQSEKYNDVFLLRETL